MESFAKPESSGAKDHDQHSDSIRKYGRKDKERKENRTALRGKRLGVLGHGSGTVKAIDERLKAL